MQIVDDLRAYQIYLDDSGQKEYHPATSRYFVYGGPMVEATEEAMIAQRFADLKERVFGDPTVEIKSNWMRQPYERRSRYLDPYGLSNKDFDAFVEEWYELMSSDDLTYLAAVIDKPQMLARYGDPWYASATAYQFLLQRYELQMRQRQAMGRVRMDDMTGSTPSQNEWRTLLCNHHVLLKKNGCRITKLTFGHIADTIRFGDSALFDLLQVADVAAYNVYRQFRSYGDEWDRTDADNVTLYPWFDRILSRFAKSPRGVIEGWGIVKWPSERKSRWVVNLDETSES